jgi:hypothetical protein
MRLIQAALIAVFAVCVCHADNNWKMVTGELSVIKKIRGDFDRDNKYSVLCYNTVSGEVRYLNPSFGASEINDSWTVLRQPQQTPGNFQMVFAEHTLIAGISPGNVDGQSLYSAFLLDKKSGMVWRLIATLSERDIVLKWMQLPMPAVEGNAEWTMSGAKYSIMELGNGKVDRQNIYALFLLETNGGNMYRVETHYYPSEGRISDKLIPVPPHK